MSPLDLLLIIFTLGAAFGGMRRGFVAEFVVMCLWIPIYATAAIIVLTSYDPRVSAESSQAVATGDVLWTLGFIFIIGSIAVYLINKIIITPWLSRRTIRPFPIIRKSLGFMLGAGRFIVVFAAVVLVYDIYVSPLNLEERPNSIYLEQVYQLDQSIKEWLINEGYLDTEIVLYDQGYEYQKNQNKMMMQGIKSKF